MSIFNKPKTKLGISFGGGGARGFAHLGVIKAFEEYAIFLFFYVSLSRTTIVIPVFFL